MKLRLPIFLFILLLFLSPLSSLVKASGFQLKTVGALNVDGITYNQLWYTVNNVSFTGIALDNAQVTVGVDESSATVNADSTGNWSYTANLADGDHKISFSSNQSSISFILTIGKDIPENVGSLPKAETPTAATTGPTIALVTMGLFLLSSPLLIKNLNKNKTQ